MCQYETNVLSQLIAFNDIISANTHRCMGKKKPKINIFIPDANLTSLKLDPVTFNACVQFGNSIAPQCFYKTFTISAKNRRP